MKKLFTVALVAVSLCSCYESHKERFIDDYGNDYVLIDITFDEHTHQFVKGKDKLAHWPSCIYCTHDSTLQNPEGNPD